MPLDRNVRRMLRDVTLLLGIPGVIVGYLILSARPWDAVPYRTHPSSEAAYDARRALERQASKAGVHELVWEELRLEYPARYYFITGEPTLELLEQENTAEIDNDHWPARMAFLLLDSAATARFRESQGNCDLVEGRCWTRRAGRYQLNCQRSSGVPDPAVPWTPHLECQVPARRIRVLVNAPLPVEADLLERFQVALTRPPGRSPID